MSETLNPNELAGKLHDGPVQAISMVALQLDAIVNRATPGDVSIDKIQTLAGHLREAARQLREMIADLRNIETGEDDD